MIILLSNNIFDGISNESYKGAIVIEGDRIKEVIRGTFEYDQYDGQIIDLNDKFVMPGLIDCHVHLIMTEPKYGRYDSRSISEGVLRSIKYLEDAINNGITTLRDCGSEHDGIFALKDFSEKNMIKAPTVITSGSAICSSGGHAPGISVVADGEAEVLKAVRELVKKGADWIKIMVTGGTATPGERIEDVQFTERELTAAISEAHRKGKKVTAHLSNLSGIKLALKCGIDCIEHAIQLDDEAIRLIQEQNTSVVHCICLTNREADDYTINVPEYVREKAMKVAAWQKESFINLKDEEILLGLGTDADGSVHSFSDAVKMEAEWMYHLGDDAAKVLKRATAVNGEILGLPVGKLKDQYYADIIAIDGNPLANIKDLGNICMVIKKGTLIR